MERPKCFRTVVKLKPVRRTAIESMEDYPYVRNVEEEVTPTIRTVVYQGGEVLATFKRMDFFLLCQDVEGLKTFQIRPKVMKELPTEGGANLLKKLHNKKPGRAVR